MYTIVLITFSDSFAFREVIPCTFTSRQDAHDIGWLLIDQEAKKGIEARIEIIEKNV